MSVSLYDEQTDHDILNFIRNQLEAAKETPEYQRLRRQLDAARGVALEADFGTGEASIRGMLKAGQTQRSALIELVTYVISVDPYPLSHKE